jgi:hypothetical protein
VQIVRIHDPARRPVGWMDIVRRGQFVLFTKDLDSGAPCDADGRPFADPAAASCVLCDSLAEARTFGEAAVARTPSLRIDVFDAEGRAHPPLLTLLHPSRAPEAETHPRMLRRRRLIACALIAAGLPLIFYAYAEHTRREIILPAFVGINMLIAAARLLWFNLGVRETERVREERVARLEPPKG